LPGLPRDFASHPGHVDKISIPDAAPRDVETERSAGIVQISGKY